MDVDNSRTHLKSKREKANSYSNSLFEDHLAAHQAMNIKTESPASDDEGSAATGSNGGTPIKRELQQPNPVKRENGIGPQQSEVKCPIPGLWLDGSFYPTFTETQIREGVANIKQEPIALKPDPTENPDMPASVTYTCGQCNMFFENGTLLAGHVKSCQAKQSCECCTTYRNSSNEEKSDMLLQLIECVRNHPCLYNAQDADFKNINLKEQIWSSIGDQCRLSNGSAARASWLKLRDSFRDSLKLAGAKQPWKYQQQMQFLVPFLKTASPWSNNEQRSGNNAVASTSTIQISTEIRDETLDDDDNNGATDIVIHSTTPAKRARMMTSTSGGTAPVEPLDVSQRSSKQSSNVQMAGTRSIDLFFMSMCETTKSLPSALQLQIKRKVFEVVLEAEEFTNRISEGFEPQNAEEFTEY